MFKVSVVTISGLFLLLGCQTTEKVYDPKYVKLAEKNASERPLHNRRFTPLLGFGMFALVNLRRFYGPIFA